MIDLFSNLWRDLLDNEHLKLWLTAGWICYVVWLGLWIVLQKRSPAATLSWLISLAALPYVGFLIYYFFGPQKIQRHRLRRIRTHAALPPPPPGQSLDPDAAELAMLAQSTTGIPPTTATRAELLIDGAQTYSQILVAIAQAREHIHLEYYIYLPDRTGTALRDALVERAKAGVKVRLLLDAVGSGKVTRRFLKPLLDAGGEFAWFHPMRLRWFWKRPWLNLRTHRKIVVIDGCVAFTGGINITDVQDERLNPDAYRDLHVRLEGDVVRSLQLVFIEDWAYVTGAVPLQLDHPAPQRGEISAQTLVSGPDSPWEAIHRLHVAAIHSATTRVWLMTPYFVPGEAAMMALTSAALGGLDVRLVVPKVSDSWLVTHAARSYFDDLLAAGVRIYEYGPRLLHTKALVCDDELAIVGSANFDHRSFRLNFEVSVLFRNEILTGRLAQLVEHECGTSVRVRNDRDRPLWRCRLPEALARLISPLL